MRTQATLIASGLLAATAFLNSSTSTRAADLELTVRNVPAPGPVAYQPAEPLNSKTPLVLDDGAGKIIPTQFDTDGHLWWYQPRACDDQGSRYHLRAAKPGEVQDSVKVTRRNDTAIDVTIDGKPFTTFNHDPDAPKPYLYPVIGPTGAPVTRDFPMKDTPEERGPDRRHSRQDHPHHTSLWTAYGDVRMGNFDKTGTDYWAVGKTKGREKVSKITAVQSGPVFGLIQADIDWVTAAGKKELGETRTYRFFKTGANERLIDTKVVFKFTEGDVMFADTKEAGIVAMRLAVSMDEQTAGKMYNSNGSVGQDQCWGKAAAWCDYVGPVDGKTVGVAIFDAKTNFGHPAHWHIRSYGLYAPNPYGLHAFGEKESGSHKWKQGETETFNYRIVIHAGDTKQAQVAEQYRVYTEPAKITATAD